MQLASSLLITNYLESGMICSIFFIKFFGVLLVACFVVGAGILLFYISALERELEKEKEKAPDISGEQ